MASIEVRPERLPVDSFVMAVTSGPRHWQVTAGGDLDTEAAWRLRERLVGIFDSGTSRIMVDVGAVRPIDFAALAVLIGGLGQLCRQGAHVALGPPNCAISRVLRRTSVADWLSSEGFLQPSP